MELKTLPPDSLISKLKALVAEERKIQEGSLNLTTVSAARVFFQREKRERKWEYSIAEKRRLLESFSGKSTREVEKELVRLSPESVTKDRVRELTEERTEIRFIQVKDSMGGKNAFPDYGTMLKVLAKEYLKKKRPDLNVSGTPLEAPAPGRSSRYISVPVIAVKANERLSMET